MEVSALESAAPPTPWPATRRAARHSIGRRTTPLTNDQKTPPQTSNAIRQLGFLPLLAIFYGYTAGGPFGYENIFSGSGPGMALVFLTFVPFFWSIPMSFAAAELNSILPAQAGFYR